MNTPGDTVIAEFQRRRNKTWQLTRPWFLVVAVGFGGFVIPFLFEISELWTLNLVFGGFIVAAVGIIRMTFIWKREYRCPACNRPIIIPGQYSGVPVDPEECPRCGVRFK